LEVIIIPVELLVACRRQYNPGITKDPPVKSQIPPEALDLNLSTEFQSTSTGTGVPNKTLKVGSTPTPAKTLGVKDRDSCKVATISRGGSMVEAC
jgi:hypothetical protein